MHASLMVNINGDQDGHKKYLKGSQLNKCEQTESMRTFAFSMNEKRVKSENAVSVPQITRPDQIECQWQKAKGGLGNEHGESKKRAWDEDMGRNVPRNVRETSHSAAMSCPLRFDLFRL